MSTAVSKITPQSAPRDAQGLEKLGIFQIRLLIEACGGLSNDGEKVAFARMGAEQKVQLAMQLLEQWDRQHSPMNGVTNGAGAAPAMMAPPVGAPMQMMAPPQGMPVMQVDPGAVAAAASAAAPAAPATSGRRPRTSSAAAAAEAPDLGTDVINLLNTLVRQHDENTTAVSNGMKELAGAITEVAKGNLQHAENYKAVYGALQQMNAKLDQNAKLATLAMALVLPLAEQTLGASREDILRATLDDVGTITQFIQQASQSGKG